jgi:DNA polymerase-4
MAERTDQPPSLRRILHIDMDAFFAAVEQRDNPALRGKPIAVGRAGARGVVAAASYEARRYGVHSAMPSQVAARKCPELIFVAPRFEVYKAVSATIATIFARYTPLIQPLSLDEAYLDVTAQVPLHGSARAIAEAIRAAIRAETGLTASAGVSYNKFLAKLASDHRKPDGIFVIPPRLRPDFVASLAVGKFHGIGPVTAARMNALGILTGADLRRAELGFLSAHFGKAGAVYYRLARAEDDRPVEVARVRKSIGAETTFTQDLRAWEELAAPLAALAAKVAQAAARHRLAGRTATVKVKYADFRQITRARSLPVAIADAETITATGRELLRPLLPPRLGIRLLGVALSHLEEEGGGRQLALALG